MCVMEIYQEHIIKWRIQRYLCIFIKKVIKNVLCSYDDWWIFPAKNTPKTFSCVCTWAKYYEFLASIFAIKIMHMEQHGTTYIADGITLFVLFYSIFDDFCIQFALETYKTL